MKRQLFICVLFTLLLPACKTSAPVNSNQTNPSPAPTLTEEQKKAKAEDERQQRTRAIEKFVNDNYKGWQLKGTSNTAFECEMPSDVPCSLHLIKEAENKVVPVMIKQFVEKDGNGYWFVYEAKPVDLSRARLEQIKAENRETVIEELSGDSRAAKYEP